MKSDSVEDEKRRRKRRKRERRSSDDTSSLRSSSSEDSRRRQRKDRKRRKKKKHKRRRKYDSSSEDSDYEKPRKSHRSESKRKRRSKARGESRDSSLQAESKEPPSTSEEEKVKLHSTVASRPPPSAKQVSARAKSMVPMSREQYEAQQAVIREVYDEETGRTRLVRGTGEIIERIVSRSDHERLNQQATRGDGSFYSRHIFSATQCKR